MNLKMELQEMVRYWAGCPIGQTREALEALEREFPQIKNRETREPILLLIPDTLKMIIELRKEQRP